MTHNCRCGYANPKSKCRCSCGGAMHGVERNAKYLMINENLGGEIEVLIKRTQGKKFLCPSCGTIQYACGWLAYPHDGGLADKDGNKWWVFLECEHCNYGASWHKVERRILVDEAIKLTQKNLDEVSEWQKRIEKR